MRRNPEFKEGIVGTTTDAYYSFDDANDSYVDTHRVW